VPAELEEAHMELPTMAVIQFLALLHLLVVVVVVTTQPLGQLVVQVVVVQETKLVVPGLLAKDLLELMEELTTLAVVVEQVQPHRERTVETVYRVA
jgi:hypothetical protein